MINFGRDEDRHHVAAPDLAGLLEIVVPTVIAAGPAHLRPSRVADGRYDGDGDAEGDEYRRVEDYCAFSTLHHHGHPW